MRLFVVKKYLYNGTIINDKNESVLANNEKRILVTVTDFKAEELKSDKPRKIGEIKRNDVKQLLDIKFKDISKELNFDNDKLVLPVKRPTYYFGECETLFHYSEETDWQLFYSLVLTQRFIKPGSLKTEFHVRATKVISVDAMRKQEPSYFSYLKEFEILQYALSKN